MTSVVLTCLLGLATPLAGQQTPPPAMPTMAPAPSAQAQQGQGRQGQQPGQQTLRAAAPAARLRRRPRRPRRPHQAIGRALRLGVAAEHPHRSDADGFAPDGRAIEKDRDDDGGRQQQRADSIAGPGQLRRSTSTPRRICGPMDEIYLSLTIFYVPEPSGQAGQQAARPRTSQRSGQRHPRGRQADADLSIGGSAGRSESDGRGDGDGR